MVILITGKAHSGKSHYAQALVKELTDADVLVSSFDGDHFRKQTHNWDFTDKGRIQNLVKVASLARQREFAGDIVILSFVAPRRAWRNMMRGFWDESRLVYLPGGTLWKDTTYETPTEDEFEIYKSKKIGGK